MALPAAFPKELWGVPLKLDEVPEEGRGIDLRADARTRALIAPAAGLDELLRLEARLEVRRQAGGARVQGVVSATVRQICVVTLDPVVNEIREDVDVAFRANGHGRQAPASEKAGADFEDADPPEPLAGDTIDLGALTVEFLLLGIDPYPRKPDAIFDTQVPPEPQESAFAALAALKEQRYRKK